MATFAVKFLGCKVSQADAMQARQALLEAGHHEAPEAEAELHLVNTCCITSEAEAKSRQSVRRSLRTVRQVLVSGCASNLSAGQFADIDPRVSALTGTSDDVAAQVGGCVDLEHDVLARERAGSPGGPDSSEAGARGGPDFPAAGAPSPSASAATGALQPAVAQPSRTRGFVKVQDGCDCHCAYCIIPTVRGGARSRPASAVLEEARRRVAQGQPEMVMTGISVGDYRDPEHGLELGQLMMEVARVPGVERVRLSSVEVIHVRDSLLEALSSEPRVCPHLHIPMQSGDDQVLHDMGRHYTSAEYLSIVSRLREAVPEVNITTDVIVGFPTETEDAFQRTLGAVEQAGISRVHTFPYSPRPGTVASALGDRVPPEEKKQRSLAMRGRSEVLSRHRRTAKLGAPERVLVDKVAESQCSGYTADYTRCYLPPGVGERGDIVEVVCRDLHADGLWCQAARDAALSS